MVAWEISNLLVGVRIPSFSLFKEINMSGEGIGILAFLFIILMGICAVVGWGMNIYKFASADFEAPYKAEIVRGVGIPFAPMGAIVGWFHIEDGVKKIVEVEGN